VKRWNNLSSIFDLLMNRLLKILIPLLLFTLLSNLTFATVTHEGKESKEITYSARKYINDGKIFFEKGSDLIVHYHKHSKGIRSTLGLDTLSTKQYIDYARKVIYEGTYVKSINAHVKKVIKGDGKVRYFMTGLKNNGNNISTFHVKRPKDLQKLLNKSGSNIPLDSIE
jgi:hypothetical protein